MTAIQFMTDASGKRISAVIPIELYEKIAAESDLEEFFEPVPYEAGPNDDETVPGEVVDIKYEKGVSLQAAWRIFRGLSQEEVAATMGTSQSNIANFEKRGKLQKKTLEKLAQIYNCRVGQLTLD